jgi:hypothetical protein
MWKCLHETSTFSVMGLPLSRYVLCCCKTIIQDSKYRYISNSYFFSKVLFLLFKGGKHIGKFFMFHFKTSIPPLDL